jgi:hypothetical protein
MDDTENADIETQFDSDTGTESGNGDDAFQWPVSPSRDWWEVTGASLGLKSDVIKFTCALHGLGGVQAKKHSAASKLAGLELNRVEAFRLARSAKVGRLLDEAAQIRSGTLPPLSEAEIDQKIDEGIRRNADALSVARFIELRERRKAAKRESEPAKEYSVHDILAELILGPSMPEIAALYTCVIFDDQTDHALINHPFIREVAPAVAKFFPEQWAKWQNRHLLEPQLVWNVEFLKECAAGPLLTGDDLKAAVKAKLSAR